MVIDSCEHVAWRDEPVRVLEETGQLTSKPLRFFDLSTFKECMQTFGHDARAVALELVESGERQAHCRTEASVSIAGGVPSRNGDAYLVPEVYENCVSASDVATRE